MYFKKIQSTPSNSCFYYQFDIDSKTYLYIELCYELCFCLKNVKISRILSFFSSPEPKALR